jgi:hypothetical protein
MVFAFVKGENREIKNSDAKSWRKLAGSMYWSVSLKIPGAQQHKTGVYSD